MIDDLRLYRLGGLLLTSLFRHGCAEPHRPELAGTGHLLPPAGRTLCRFASGRNVSSEMAIFY
jgi:hypothetical protein